MRNMARMALAERRRRKMATMADSGSSSDGSSGDEEEEGTGLWWSQLATPASVPQHRIAGAPTHTWTWEDGG
jgi:hypothetical protein